MNDSIEVNPEMIYHFKCQHCLKWWSIGDWTPTKELWCTHCGVKSEVVSDDKEG
jgi:hypothetical protein